MPTLKLSTTDDSGASPLATAMKQRRQKFPRPLSTQARMQLLLCRCKTASRRSQATRQLATVLGRQLVDEWRWNSGSVRVTSAVSRLADCVGPLGVSG
jgi:hypothetical protein